MTVAFLGLTGPLGRAAAPLHRAAPGAAPRTGDRALAAFLDLFNHRLISLFYRAWEKYRFAVAYERGEDDRVHRSYLFHLIGLGTRGPAPAARRSPTRRCSPTPASSPSGTGRAVVLEALLRDYFGAAGRGPAVRRPVAAARPGRPLDRRARRAAQRSWASAWSWASASGTSRASSGSGSGR